MSQLNEKNNIDDMLDGINKEFFDELLKEIHGIVFDDVVVSVKDSNELVRALKSGWNSEECQTWIDNFNNLSNEVVESIENNYNEVENEFNKLLLAWEEYKKENNV